MSAESNERQPLLVTDNTITEENNTNDTPWYKVVIGVLLVVFAGCLFTGANVIQKIVCPSINFWSLFLFRGLTQGAVTSLYVVFRGTSLLGPRESRWQVYFQGFFGGLLLLAVFVAVKNVPLGSASAIFFCTPIATFVFAICMLKEPLKLYRMLIITFMMTGVILITRPGFFGFEQDPIKHHANKLRLVGYCAAVSVPVLSAIVSIWTRQCRKVDPFVVMFWFALGSIMWSLIGSAALGYIHNIFKMTRVELGWTFAIVFLGMCGNFSYTIAVKWVSPTKANVFRSFEVILNYGLQLHFEHMRFHPTDVVGIVFLLLAVVATGFEKEVIKKKLHPWI